MSNNLTVGIIGAGASGLETAREMLDQGIRPTIFEKNSTFGGVWRVNEGGNVWKNMRTNLSRFNVSFSNHNWSEETDLYPTSEDVHQYLIELWRRN